MFQVSWLSAFFSEKSLLSEDYRTCLESSLIARFELIIIGFVAGTLAGITAGIAAWALGRYVLEIEFNAFAQALAMGVIFGVIACLAAGYRFQRKIQITTAIECLREV